MVKKYFLNRNHIWPTLFVKIVSFSSWNKETYLDNRSSHPNSWQYPLINYPAYLVLFSGKLEYEYQKNKQKEDFGVSERSREVKSFEPTTAPPSDDEELDGIFGIECDVEIVNENAEDDDEY